MSYVLLTSECSEKCNWTAYHRHPAIHKAGNSRHHRFPSSQLRVGPRHPGAHHLWFWWPGNDGDGTLCYFNFENWVMLLAVCGSSSQCTYLNSLSSCAVACALESCTAMNIAISTVPTHAVFNPNHPHKHLPPSPTVPTNVYPIPYCPHKHLS